MGGLTLAYIALTSVQGAHIRGADDMDTAPVTSEVDVYGPNGNPAGLALQKMTDTLDLVKAGYSKSASICVEEEKLTVAWSNEVQDMGNAARKASKEKLAAALEKRLAGLRKFLKRLKKMRGRLREHIVRVNTIYETKYTENLDNVHLAANVLKELGMIQTEPWNPHINPIKNFKSFTEAQEDGDKTADVQGASGAEGGAAVSDEATPPAAFMQLEETNYQKAGSECKAATGAAFNVYELGLKLNSMMDESFENEREVLKEFRETLGMMIAKREAKLNAMELQLAKLKAALAGAGAPFAELKEGLKQHLIHVKNACAVHAKQESTVTTAIGGVVTLIQEHHSEATGGSTGLAAPVGMDETPDGASGSAF